MLEVSLENDVLHVGANLSISFQRTLRVPQDSGTYPLPPALGRFPLVPVDYASQPVPKPWIKKNSFLVPMYQKEALWIAFDSATGKPQSVLIEAGSINVVTGEQSRMVLKANPQNYIVTPDQMWLDGINAGENFVRQFVAAALGEGLTLEAQLTGQEKIGGVQIKVFDAKPDFDFKTPVKEDSHRAAIGMGLGAGGKIRQKIYPDPYGIDVWDAENFGELAIHILNTEEFLGLTGRQPPPSPISVETYNRHGLPWFKLYEEDRQDLPSAPVFRKIKPIGD